MNNGNNIKAIFFASPDNDELEPFINELIDNCKRHNLGFNHIMKLFEKIFNQPS